MAWLWSQNVYPPRIVKNWHGHWVCWMSTGRKNGSMQRTHNNFLGTGIYIYIYHLRNYLVLCDRLVSSNISHARSSRMLLSEIIPRRFSDYFGVQIHRTRLKDKILPPQVLSCLCDKKTFDFFRIAEEGGVSRRGARADTVNFIVLHASFPSPAHHLYVQRTTALIG